MNSPRINATYSYQVWYKIGLLILFICLVQIHKQQSSIGLYVEQTWASSFFHFAFLREAWTIMNWTSFLQKCYVREKRKGKDRLLQKGDCKVIWRLSKIARVYSLYYWCVDIIPIKDWKRMKRSSEKLLIVLN